jgi:hypothetical protein
MDIVCGSRDLHPLRTGNSGIVEGLVSVWSHGHVRLHRSMAWGVVRCVARWNRGSLKVNGHLVLHRHGLWRGLRLYRHRRVRKALKPLDVSLLDVGLGYLPSRVYVELRFEDAPVESIISLLAFGP